MSTAYNNQFAKKSVIFKIIMYSYIIFLYVLMILKTFFFDMIEYIVNAIPEILCQKIKVKICWIYQLKFKCIVNVDERFC